MRFIVDKNGNDMHTHIILLKKLYFTDVLKMIRSKVFQTLGVQTLMMNTWVIKI